MDLLATYQHIRDYTTNLCRPLETEDYVVQPTDFVSPPKWHLGHTTWFFETFILKPNMPTYQEFDAHFNFIFNSYYETAGERVLRAARGNLSRPTVTEVMRYRKYVDEYMAAFLAVPIQDELAKTLIIGLNHEQQHQELLLMDIKYIFGHNPLFPAYVSTPLLTGSPSVPEDEPLIFQAGIYEIGAAGESFCYDNEIGRHKVFLEKYAIDSQPVRNRNFIEFIESGGYHDFHFWHSEGWEWRKANQIENPLYWNKVENEWQEYSLAGLHPISPDAPVCHISYYEAAAFAAWAEMRLPTEAEWEVAADKFKWGKCWEWTESAYLPYPGYRKPEGAIGEYNAKFMVSQMVLRGGSVATPEGHSRKTYRNFFYPADRWQFSGLRLAQSLND